MSTRVTVGGRGGCREGTEGCGGTGGEEGRGGEETAGAGGETEAAEGSRVEAAGAARIGGETGGRETARQTGEFLEAVHWLSICNVTS